MPGEQLRLFEPPRPLLERFGVAFFKAVPPRPGIYIMGGDGGRVLYIGQSGNLRRRLGSYKNARPDREPRKIIRLVHSVRSLVWEECGSAEDARVREAQLLRVHRPKFNAQYTHPLSCRFISFVAASDVLRLSLGTQPVPSAKSFGAFKAGSTRAFAALLRRLWAARHPGAPCDFPARLLQARPPNEFAFSFSSAGGECELMANLSSLLEAFLRGESDRLAVLLAETLCADAVVHPFWRNLLSADLETLAEFFRHGPRRLREFRERHGIEGALISPEMLDDLTALDRGRKRAADEPAATPSEERLASLRDASSEKSFFPVVSLRSTTG